MAKKVPASAWFAEVLLTGWKIKHYAEDPYEYDEAAGLYVRKSKQWLYHQVEKALCDENLFPLVGSDNVTASLVNDVLKSIENQSYVSEKQQPPFWISSGEPADVLVVKNGVLDLSQLRDGGGVTLKPHDPDLFAVAGTPVEYDPAATCPNWMEFLRWMVGGDDAIVQLLQEYCGWVFVSRRLRLEKLLWLVGPGRNGKSIFLRIVRHVLGEDSTSAVGLEAFGSGAYFQLMPTLYKLANFTPDAAVRTRMSVAALNAYVSGDPVTVNRKFREQLTVEPSAVLFVASNPLPSFADDSDAFWRRLLLIPCRQRLRDTEVDPDKFEKLKQEAPGILRWMFEGIPALVARKRFDIPQAVKDGVDSLKNEANSARLFIKEKVTDKEVQDGDCLIRDTVMTLYEGWCKENGLESEKLPVMKAEMAREFAGIELSRFRVERKGSKKDNRVTGWKGLKWKPDETFSEKYQMFMENWQLIARASDEKSRVEKELRATEKVLWTLLPDSEVPKCLVRPLQEPSGAAEPPRVVVPPNPTENKLAELHQRATRQENRFHDQQQKLARQEKENQSLKEEIVKLEKKVKTAPPEPAPGVAPAPVEPPLSAEERAEIDAIVKRLDEEDGK